MILFHLILEFERIEKYEQKYEFAGRFLNQARREKIAVTIFLTNGFQFKGIVKGFDSYVVILDSDGKQNLVYKHAISTIIPVKSISILDSSDRDEEGDR